MSVSAAGTLLLLVGVLAGYAAEEHVLDWTVEGVDKYREDPLEVKFGDVLTLNCHPTNISNFVYVESREQYDSCNASATDGKVLRSGDCLGTFSNAKSFSQNIQRLSGAGQAVVEYQAGNLFYFYSSADGSLGSGEPPYVGGQCLEGLKMIIYVVDESAIPSTTTLPRLSPTVTLDKPGGTGKSSGGGVFTIALGILTGFAIVIVVIVVLIVALCCAYCVRKRSKTGKENISSMESGDSVQAEHLLPNTLLPHGKDNDDGKKEEETEKVENTEQTTTKTPKNETRADAAIGATGQEGGSKDKRMKKLTKPLPTRTEGKMGEGGNVKNKQQTAKEKAGASTKPGAATGATGQGGGSKVSKMRTNKLTDPLPTTSVSSDKKSVPYTKNEDQKSTGKDGRKGSVVDNGKKERTDAATGGSQVNGGGKKDKGSGGTKANSKPPKPPSNGREATSDTSQSQEKSKSTPKSNTPKNHTNNTPKNDTNNNNTNNTSASSGYQRGSSHRQAPPPPSG